MIQRFKDVVVHRILGVDDTPHRIAWGVLLGFVIGWTPTLGFQIVLYVALATVVRANKVSGIPILFISNPFTAVPLYYFCWKVGSFLLHGGVPTGEQSEVRERLSDAAVDDFWGHVFDGAFWSDLGQTLLDMGAEMWLGSLVMGVLTGVPCYFLTLWGVRMYRRRMGR